MKNRERIIESNEAEYDEYVCCEEENGFPGPMLVSSEIPVTSRHKLNLQAVPQMQSNFRARLNDPSPAFQRQSINHPQIQRR